MNTILVHCGKNLSMMMTGIAFWLILTETGVIKTKSDQISEIVEAGSEVTITTPEPKKVK